MIIVSRVSKYFGDKLIFKDVSFELEQGQGIFIFGPNGCGKSTLLKIIAGILMPSKGEVTFKGIKKIGYMGHFHSVYSTLTALENLRFWSDLYGLGYSKQDLVGFLERVELGSVSFEKTSIFSRGMIQRFNIARIMVIDPDIYLLDEPETGLDTDSKKMFFELIENALYKKKIVLWVSHTPPLNSSIKKVLRYKNKGFVIESI